MSLKKYRAFVETVDLGSLTKAAERLFITPSALTQQVLRLENELHAPLFIRSRSGWQPTEAGEIYLEAARKMSRRTPGVANDALCMLVVCNTASIQLIPTTVAAVRSGAGCSTPFDILPAVWLASALSVTAGICAAKLLRRVWR